MPAAVDGLKECTKCGETKPVSEYNGNKRHTDGLQYACKRCQKKGNKKYYENNKERVLKRQREYQKANKEYIRERTKKYYQDNKEEIDARVRRWRRANKERLHEYVKVYRQKLPAAVYKIENKVTGKIYIGQSTRFHMRWYSHRSRMRNGKHHRDLQRDHDEHGLDSFEFSVIQEYPSDTSREILFEHEQQLINEYIAEGKELYNIRTDA